jgi:hypothetical protein
MLDPSQIVNELVVSAVGVAVFWVVATIRKMRGDLNSAFSKIRDLEGKQ